MQKAALVVLCLVLFVAFSFGQTDNKSMWSHGDSLLAKTTVEAFVFKHQMTPNIGVYNAGTSTWVWFMWSSSRDTGTTSKSWLPLPPSTTFNVMGIGRDTIWYKTTHDSTIVLFYGF